MSNKPYISIIIPTYQEERLLEQTLRQFSSDLCSAHNLELIVSDGGSTDNTLGIAKKYTCSVIEHTLSRRQNISQGRNAGARAAQGELLVFINADTLIEDIDSFFSILKQEALKQNVSGITCSVSVHKDQERLSDKIFHGLYNWYFWFLNVIGIGMGRGECQVVRRELFLSIGGYNERIAAGEDFDLFVRLKRFGDIVFLSRLKVRESPRRYRKYGYVYITIVWFLNAIFVLFIGKSLATEWKPVR